MKLLYLPNEENEGDQVGPRNALSLLTKRGLLNQVEFFSYSVEARLQGSWVKMMDKLFNQVEHNRPDYILVQHLGKNKITEKDVKIIKSFYKNRAPIIAYDERDVYGYIRKPLPTPVIEFAKLCDAVFLVAAGEFAARFRRFGCKKVFYLPNVANDDSFGKPWQPTFEREYDVIMIGNRITSKVPFLVMPGEREREVLIRKLSSKFGERFAIFGNGWKDYKGNKGPIPFLKQEEIARQSWICIGHDHFYEYEGYFSNRLPIALFSGVPYVSRKTPGIENLLIDGLHCKFYSSLDEGVKICEELLKLPREKLIDLGLQGAKYGKKILNEEVRMKRLIEILTQIEQSRALTGN